MIPINGINGIHNPTNGKLCCLCSGNHTGTILGLDEVGHVIIAQEMLDHTFPTTQGSASVCCPTSSTGWTAQQPTQLRIWDAASVCLCVPVSRAPVPVRHWLLAIVGGRIALDAIIIVPDQSVANSSTLDQQFALNTSPHHGVVAFTS